MGENSLAVEVRNETGKGFARVTRAAGRLPAVLYGHGREAVSLTLNATDLETLLSKSEAGLNTLIDLDGAGGLKGRVVLIKELQRHPVRGDLVHADFFEIDAKEQIHATIPIHLVGTSPGVKLGGILEHSMREVEVSCLPAAIPDSIEVDISKLEMEETIHVSDLNFPSGVEIVLDPALPVAHVSAPKAAEEEEIASEDVAETSDEGGDAPASD